MSGDIIDEVCQAVAWATKMETYDDDVVRPVASALLSSLAQRNIGVYRQTGPKVREAKAIADAKYKLRHSIEVLEIVGGNAASAVALQGILVILIEMQERQWDAPCDCFAGEPIVFKES